MHLKACKSILLIAYRLTTMQRCDFIVELEHGRVVQARTNNCWSASPSSAGWLGLFEKAIYFK